MAGRSGAFTFLYTDIVGSSRLWERDPSGAAEFLQTHNDVVRECVAASGGEVFKSLGDGLASLFVSPSAALEAAIDIQKRLTEASLPTSVRVGVHSGDVTEIEGDFMGTALNRVARIVDMAHGRQILVSETTVLLTAEGLPTGASTACLGEFTLDGNERPERLYQLCAPGLPSDFAPLPQRGRHNLTALEREFVGREKERAQVGEALTDPKRRLVTVLGFGGVGKTTLARRAAWDALASFPDGVWWADCETATTRDHVLQEVGSALGEPIDPMDPERSLWAAVGDQEMLLVCDCFEVVVDHAEVLDALLKHCPNLKLLVTSRIVLGSPFEYEFALRGLGSTKGAGSAGVELFVQAAAQAQEGFALTRTTRPLVSQLVRDLEGLPLALILAAGRLRHMSLVEVCGQVRLSALSIARSVGRPGGRHSGLRTVIEASMSLLPEPEQAALLDLSVFVGGFDLAAAQGVLLDRPQVLDLVSVLRDHSLLSQTIDRGQSRYRQLDSVREFTSERLGSDRLAELRKRHSEWFCKVAERLRALFNSGEAAEASMRLAVDGPNLRLGFQAAVESGCDGLVAAYGQSLARVLVEAGLTGDFETVASEAGRVARELGDSSLLAEILGLQGIVARRAGNVAAARAAWRERLAVFESLGEAGGQLDALGDLADLAVITRDDSEMDQILARYHGFSKDQLDINAATAIEVFGMLRDSWTGQKERALAAADGLLALNFEPADRNLEPYVLRACAEAFRTCGEFEKSKASGLRMLEAAASSHHLPRAARALDELFATATEAGRAADVELVLAVAELFPRNSRPKFAVHDPAKKPASSGGTWAELAMRLVADASPNVIQITPFGSQICHDSEDEN